jgi:hypothetical protein
MILRDDDRMAPPMPVREWLQQIDPAVAREFGLELAVLDACLDPSGKVDLRTAPYVTADTRKLVRRAVFELPTDPMKRLEQAGSLADLDVFEPEQQRRFVLALFSALRVCPRERCPDDFRWLLATTRALLRRKSPFTFADAPLLLDGLVALRPLKVDELPVAEVLNGVELAVRGQPLTAEIRKLLTGIRDAVSAGSSLAKKERAKLVEKIDRMCDDSVTAKLQPDGGWADAVRETLSTLPAKRRALWEDLLTHAARIVPDAPPVDWSVSMQDMQETAIEDPDAWQDEYSRRVLARAPAPEWIESAERRVSEIGPSEFTRWMIDWLERVPDSRPGYLIRESLNRELLRGLLWCCTCFDDQRLIRAMRAAGDFLFKKNSPLGTTVVQILCRMPGGAAMSELGLLGSQVKAGSRKNLIRTAMRDRASATGLPAPDIEELGLPTFGMAAVGLRREDLRTVREISVVSNGVLV